MLMTDNSSTKALDAAMTKLAKWINELEMLADDNTSEILDHLNILEMLRPLTAELIFQSICDMLEVCPTHICDYRICVDDQRTDCTQYADWIDMQNELQATRFRQEYEVIPEPVYHSERDNPGWRC